MNKFIPYLRKNMLIPLLIILFLVSSLFVGNISSLIPSYFKIITNKILQIDYLQYGLNATLFNVAINLLVNFIFVKFLKLRISGPIFAGMFLNVGFSFFGVNVLNFLPFYLGIYIYSKISKTTFRNLIIPILSSCGIAPVLSFIAFGLGLPVFAGLLISLVVGLGLGLIIPSIASHVIIFHSGYSLYNLGFTLGLLSFLIYGFFAFLKIDINYLNAPIYAYEKSLYAFFLAIAFLFISFGLKDIKQVFKSYKKLLTKSGRLVQDFIRDYNHETVFLNIGINLLMILLLVFIFQIQISGLVVASIFTVISFSAMGKHIKNIVPVMVGAFLAAIVLGYTNNPTISAAIIFSTTLAPLSGRYKFIVGIIAGFLHLIATSSVAAFQGPFNLFLNGFTGAFIAAILISVIESFERN